MEKCSEMQNCFNCLKLNGIAIFDDFLKNITIKKKIRQEFKLYKNIKIRLILNRSLSNILKKRQLICLKI